MKLVTVVGARPQFIKAAAVSRKLRLENEEILVHTGQHYDANMSDVFFEEMHIPRPDYNLQISGGSHGEMTGRMLMELERLLIKEAPDAGGLHILDALTQYLVVVHEKIHSFGCFSCFSKIRCFSLYLCRIK